ncbi:DUF2934 domain-containing protein [Variovorax robiniae]|uniref:DUF2934 domain-containing protein n=1 Tax=Variovorax robiniae TaxID=1836199 RepID=A0ABU8XJK5_9BURK
MAVLKVSTASPGTATAADGALPTEAEVRAVDLEREDGETARPISPDSTSEASADELREDMIRREAYAIYERRGGEPGDEKEDWLAAEREVDGSKPLVAPQDG